MKFFERSFSCAWSTCTNEQINSSHRIDNLNYVVIFSTQSIYRKPYGNKTKTPRAKVIRSESTIRVSSRIDSELYLMLKNIYGTQGWTMEDRINELLEKDYEYMLRQKWVIDLISKSKGRAFDKYMDVRDKVRSGIITANSPASSSSTNDSGTDFNTDPQFEMMSNEHLASNRNCFR